MIVIPNNSAVGMGVNLEHCQSIERAEGQSNYTSTMYLINFFLEHKVVQWKFTTELERDAAWADITGTSYVKMCGPVV